MTKDSRQLRPEESIVIGTIRHENAKIIRLVSDNDEINSLGVTPSHPLYSVDRNQWVAAVNFRIGEKIKTQGGQPSRVIAIHKGRRTTVYNLEVHRAKSYFVGKQLFLAHNTGIDCQLKDGSIKEMYDESIQKLKTVSSSTTVKEMADAYESMVRQINTKHASWDAKRSLGTDGSYVFVGGYGEALVIAPSGKIFRGNIGPSFGQFSIGKGGVWTPIYNKLKER